METFVEITKSSKRDIYEEIYPQLVSLVKGEKNFVANLANTAAILKMAFPVRISWVGFYLLEGKELVLGPFQGKPACVRISMGKGVCGTAAAERRTVIVPDVEKYPGHIFCDPASRSEIVVPMLRGKELIGVLDLDSPALAAFDGTDKAQLEMIAQGLSNGF